MPVGTRFWSKVDFGSVGDCWSWTASKNKQGYGQFRLEGKGKKAHRVAYELVNGPLAGPHVKLDHKCRNTSCVNPLHLEPVSQKENVIRGSLGGFGRCRTHCPQDHEYTEENTYVTPSGVARCRICKRAQFEAFKERQRASR